MVIWLIVIGLIVLLGRYAIEGGQREERKKKFIDNMNNFDEKYSKKSK